jgi:hypothetical protein
VCHVNQAACALLDHAEAHEASAGIDS